MHLIKLYMRRLSSNSEYHHPWWIHSSWHMSMQAIFLSTRQYCCENNNNIDLLLLLLLLCVRFIVHLYCELLHVKATLRQRTLYITLFLCHIVGSNPSYIMLIVLSILVDQKIWNTNQMWCVENVHQQDLTSYWHETLSWLLQVRSKLEPT